MGNSSAHLPRDNETCKEKQIFLCCVSKVVCKNMLKYADDRSKRQCSSELWWYDHTSRLYCLYAVCSCGSVRSEYSIFSLVCESVWTRVVMLARVCERGGGVVCCILISSSCMCPLLKACLLYRRIRGLLCCDKTLLAQKHTWNGERDRASVGKKKKEKWSFLHFLTSHTLRMVSGTPSGQSP